MAACSVHTASKRPSGKGSRRASARTTPALGVLAQQLGAQPPHLLADPVRVHDRRKRQLLDLGALHVQTFGHLRVAETAGNRNRDPRGMAQPRGDNRRQSISSGVSVLTASETQSRISLCEASRGFKSASVRRRWLEARCAAASASSRSYLSYASRCQASGSCSIAIRAWRNAQRIRSSFRRACSESRAAWSRS